MNTKTKLKKIHALEWLLGPLENHSGYERKRKFGCEAAYVDGRLTLVLSAGEEPWNGLLVATEREYHSDLQQRYPCLRSHSVLGKWLYISQADPSFEETAIDIVKSVKRGDPLIGVQPKLKKSRKRKRRIISTSSER